MVEEEKEEQEQERLRRVKEEESKKLSSHVKDQETWGVSIASNNLSSLRSKAETFRNIEQIVLVATKKEGCYPIFPAKEVLILEPEL